MAAILIIDDDKDFCFTLDSIVRTTGCATECAYTLKEGLAKAESGQFDIVFLDVMMPDGIGLDIIPDLLAISSEPEVIIMTSRGDPNGAELAIKSGVWDYVEKPSSMDQIILHLKRALQYRKTKQISEQVLADPRKEGIIGSSPQMKTCLDLLNKAAQSDANVIITGETGTGKELFARFIHDHSCRKKKDFVIVDCAAIPEALVESILFGHEKGAFTGADKTKIGLVKQADGGTLFLDEIGELPLSIQKAFLRVIQERRVRAVGAKEEFTSNFRVVAATNRDLEDMVGDKTFREDLLYRLKTFVIEIPALRQRKSDIRELTEYFTDKICNQYQLEKKGLSSDFLEFLESYQWPGNIRELIHALERAIAATGQEPILFVKHLPEQLRTIVTSSRLEKNISAENQQQWGKIQINDHFPTMKAYREDIVAKAENSYLNELMNLAKGDITQACKISGLQRSRMYGLLKKYNILAGNSAK